MRAIILRRYVPQSRPLGIGRWSRIGLAVLLFSSPFVVAANTLNGEARGRVRDIVSGNPITDATMTLVNVARGWSRLVPTSPDGKYVFILLEPGS